MSPQTTDDGRKQEQLTSFTFMVLSTNVIRHIIITCLGTGHYLTPLESGEGAEDFGASLDFTFNKRGDH